MTTGSTMNSEAALERLSGLMDGSATDVELELALREIAAHPEHRSEWADWNAVRALMRQETEPGDGLPEGVDLTDRVLAQIQSNRRWHGFWKHKVASPFSVAACMALGSFTVMNIWMDPYEMSADSADTLQRAVESENAQRVLSEAIAQSEAESNSLPFEPLSIQGIPVNAYQMQPQPMPASQQSTEESERSSQTQDGSKH
ncbi:MAG: sigma-E factor negative regulatory protein [Gammaproteobacteria bacterium AqS3]|nr:sigma-E factor negative regulatory protein [Gammaproteobacteria bacterium AqS3]